MSVLSLKSNSGGVRPKISAYLHSGFASTKLVQTDPTVEATNVGYLLFPGIVLINLILRF